MVKVIKHGTHYKKPLIFICHICGCKYSALEQDAWKDYIVRLSELKPGFVCNCPECGAENSNEESE